MGKTFEALERYRKENSLFAEAGALRQAGWDAPPEDPALPAATNTGCLKRRENIITATGGEQVSPSERRLLNAHQAEGESERPAAGSSGNLELTLIQPGYRYHPPLHVSEGFPGCHNQDRVNEWMEHPTGRFQRSRLKTPFAKQIVLNLKPGIIQSIIRYKYFLVLLDYLKYTDGELIKFENQSFYRLNFKSKARLPILLDRTGELKNFFQQSKPIVARQNDPGAPFNLLDPDAIRQVELKLICNIFEAAHPDSIKAAFMAIFDLTIEDQIECRAGRIVALNGEVAYELMIDLKLRFSIFMDVHGNLLDVTDDNPEVSPKVIRDHSIHRRWVAPVNLFENRESDFSTLQYPAHRY
jgi:hypothetical protein